MFQDLLKDALSAELPTSVDRLQDAIERACQGIQRMVERGYTRWLVMYSGGKDSTTALVLCAEAAKAHGFTLEVLYCNTGIEIPTLRDFARSFLDWLRAAERAQITELRPAVEDSFWVQLIGKGYPPPHQHFRWCTRRLKIKPVEDYLRNFSSAERPLIVTGVRLGESDARDLRLQLSCARGGECGQGVWYEESQRLQLGYFSPILVWRECEVWDFLNFIAPAWGYPTRGLFEVYQGRETRFGCWTCSVISQDRTMQRIVQKREDLAPLLEFRNWLVEFAKQPQNRVLKPNGDWGRLTLKARFEILRRLRAVEQTLGEQILSSIEYHRICQLWESPHYADTY